MQTSDIFGIAWYNGDNDFIFDFIARSDAVCNYKYKLVLQVQLTCISSRPARNIHTIYFMELKIRIIQSMFLE